MSENTFKAKFTSASGSGGGGSSPSPANPTAEVTDTAVNGTASTYMRSDSAPALADSGVVAGTYGDSTNVAQIIVDDKGRVTEVTNVTISSGSTISPANPTASIGATATNGVATTYMRSDSAPALETTGVTAGFYGDSANIPRFNVDATGRITSISTETNSQPANPTAEVTDTAVNGVAPTYMRSDSAPALANSGVVAGTYGNATNVPQVIVDAKGRVTSVTNVAISGGGGGASAYTTLTGGATIDWDFATDGVNIKITLVAGQTNILTVSSISEFPDGSSGFIILDPTNSTSYKLPDEDYGSATGIESKLSGGNATLGGTNPVLFHWTYDGSTFYFQKDVNYIDPVYPPDIQFNTQNLIAYYTPQAFNQSSIGTVGSGVTIENLTSSNLIGDLITSSNVTNFEFYPKTSTEPAYWSMGDASGRNAILRSSAIASGISTEATFSGYMQGQYLSGTFKGVFDFFGTQGSAAYDQQVYLTNLEFRVYSPDYTFNYPALSDYSALGGADLQNEWLFMSFAYTPSTSPTASDGFIRMAIGCKSSYDWAIANPPVAPATTTAWDYQRGNGTGLTVDVDANGLYFETSSLLDLDEVFFENFYLGNSSDLTEGNQAHYGEFGIFNSVIPDSQVIGNWNGSRATYGIS